MDKKKVINKIKDAELNERQRFSALIPALSSAPRKNLSLTAHYNRSGFSKDRLKSLIYDVQKAWSISDAELRNAVFVVKKGKKAKKSKKADLGKEDETQTEEEKANALQQANEELKALDLEKAGYHEFKGLAFTLAKLLDVELQDKTSATLSAFLAEQKKSLEQGE